MFVVVRIYIAKFGIFYV